MSRVALLRFVLKSRRGGAFDSRHAAKRATKQCACARVAAAAVADDLVMDSPIGAPPARRKGAGLELAAAASAAGAFNAKPTPTIEWQQLQPPPPPPQRSSIISRPTSATLAAPLAAVAVAQATKAAPTGRPAARRQAHKVARDKLAPLAAPEQWAAQHDGSNGGGCVGGGRSDAAGANAAGDAMKPDEAAGEEEARLT